MKLVQGMTIGLALTAMTLGGIARAEEGGPLQGPKVDAPKQDGPRRTMDGERPRGERPHGPMADRMRGLMEGVNLTEEQKAQARPIMEAAAEKWKAFHEEHKDEIAQARDEMKAARESGDREKMRAAGQKLRGIMEQADFRGDAIEQIKKLLTPEQLATFEKNLQEMKDRGPGAGGPRLSPEEREKLKNMTPEERREYLQKNHPRREGGEGQRREGNRKPEGEGKKPDAPKGLDL